MLPLNLTSYLVAIDNCYTSDTLPHSLGLGKLHLKHPSLWQWVEAVTCETPPFSNRHGWALLHLNVTLKINTLQYLVTIDNSNVGTLQTPCRIALAWDSFNLKYTYPASYSHSWTLLILHKSVTQFFLTVRCLYIHIWNFRVRDILL